MWVNFLLESLEELLTGWPCPGAAVFRSAPRDFSGYPLVDVLGCYAPHLLSPLRSVLVSAFVSSRVYAPLRADTRAER